MFLRVLFKSIVNRKAKVAIAVAAVALGSAIAGALMSVTLGINDKVSRELKSYGANLLLVPEREKIKVEVGGVDYTPPMESEYIDERLLPNLKEIFWRHNIIALAPHLYALVSLPDQKITLPLIGTWFDKELILSDGERFHTGLRHLNKWWQVNGAWVDDANPSPASPFDSCMIGSAIAKRLNLGIGQRFGVSYIGNMGSERIERTLNIVGIVHTGGFEDEQIFVALKTAQDLMGASGKVSQVQVSALTIPETELAKKDPNRMTPQEHDRWYCSPYLSSISRQIQDALPGVLAKPIEQIAHAEANVLKKIRLMLILITSAALMASGLGVMSTMTTIIIERSSEVGLMKALGAEKGKVITLFLSESAAIGLIGGAVGYGFGIFLAQIVGKSVFHSTIAPSLVIIPFVLALAIGISLLGSALPVKNALKFEPMVTLRGK